VYPLTSSPGRDGLTPVAFTCSAPAGAKLTFLWRENPDGSVPGAIDRSHKGPATVYIKAVPGSMAATPAAGPGWAKIWEDGYDPATRRWGTENVMAAGGLMSVALPPGLPAGAYLVRAELLALHNAPSEPQFYIGCAQVFVAGPAPAGPLRLPADREVSIPGFVAPTDRGVAFNIYGRAPTSYPVPGPPVFVPAAAPAEDGPPAVQTEGRIPEGCLLKNANWCGLEVPAYTGQAGCWTAAENCSRQEAACYAAAPPSGESNCRVWSRDKCRKVQASCSGAGRGTSGPPDRGVKLQEVFAPVPGPIPPPAKLVARRRSRR